MNSSNSCFELKLKLFPNILAENASGRLGGENYLKENRENQKAKKATTITIRRTTTTTMTMLIIAKWSRADKNEDGGVRWLLAKRIAWKPQKFTLKQADLN